MKRSLLLFLLMVSSGALVFSQTPCISDYQINNGGGNCPVLNVTSATGTVTLSFNGTVDPLNIPTIVSAYENSDPLNPVLITDVDFGTGTLLNNGDVKYCYYVGPNNNNNLQGHNSVFKFIISYNNNTPCGGDQGALPVIFRSFTALRNNTTVSLKWTTATESNCLGFEIQRLIDKGTWHAVSFIASKAVSGNSSTDIAYSYEDVNSSKGITQYRIRQVDIDNRSKLSDIRAVRGDGQKSSIIVYPNPSSDGKVNILFDDVDAARDVSVTDMSGRTIKQMKGVTNNNITVENLVPGMYTVRIVNNETSKQDVQKFVVNKR